MGTKAMREGALLVTSLRAKSFYYIVRQLKKCADKYDGCDGCPDLKQCIKAYDDRCTMGKKKRVFKLV